MATFFIDNLPAPINFECGKDIVLRTLQNAKNLLMTRMGEVPYDRLRGFNVMLYDLPIEQMREEVLPELDRVMLWEPDVEVESAECYLDGNGEVVIKVVLEMNDDMIGGMADEHAGNALPDI